MDEGLIIAAIDEEIGKLKRVRALLSGSAVAATIAEKTVPVQKAVRQRRMSLAARKRMAEAQKKRWAAVKTKAGKVASVQESGKIARAEKSPKGRRLSPAARKRIAEAQKRRWAATKAAKLVAGKKAAKNAPAKRAGAVKAPAKTVKKVTKKSAFKRASLGKNNKAVVQKGATTAPISTVAAPATESASS